MALPTISQRVDVFNIHMAALRADGAALAEALAGSNTPLAASILAMTRRIDAAAETAQQIVEAATAIETAAATRSVAPTGRPAEAPKRRFRERVRFIIPTRS